MATGRLPDPNTAPVTAKGDLYTYSTVPAKLAVGNNGETLVADSSASTGLSWQPTVAAGKNLLINGAMDIWQRGTSFAATPSNFTYLSDRWFWIGATASIAQETTIVPAGFRYSLKATATASTQPVFGQVIETANCYHLAGKRVTLSAWMATSNSSNVTLRIDYTTSVDSAANATWTTLTATAGSNDVTATSTMTRKSLSFDIPANALSLRILFLTAGNIPNAATFTITGCQLELGSVATQFTRAGGTLAGELAACQRYYWRNTAPLNNSVYGFGMSYSTTAGRIFVPLPVQLRTQPTAVEYTTLQVSDYANYGTDISSLTLVDSASANTNSMVIGFASTGLTANVPLFLRAKTANTSYLGFSAEL